MTEADLLKATLALLDRAITEIEDLRKKLKKQNDDDAELKTLVAALKVKSSRLDKQLPTGT